jgi:phosphatidylserine/phosphatidylglycerophosphate/cardiolipin synthase-like enzyme
MNKLQVTISSVALAALLVAAPVDAKKKSESVVDAVVAAYESNHSFTIPAAGTIEVAFSPNEGSEHLVVKVIDSAKSELLVLSYSFTSAPVTAALLRAKKRGVDVRLVADQRNNVSEDRSGKSRAALSALVNAGVDVRTISVYPIHHDFRGVSNG